MKTLKGRPTRNSRTALVRQWWALHEQRARRRRDAATHEPSFGLGDGLLAHFGLDENGGNRVDDVGGYVLEPTGPLAAGSGVIGSSVELNASYGLVGQETTSLFSPTASGFTVAFWVNCSVAVNLEEASYFVSVWDDGVWPAGSSWQVYSSTPSSGALDVQLMCDGGWNYLVGAVNWSGWVHVCLVYAEGGGLWRLYANGAQVATVAYGCATPSGRLGVGQHTNSSGPWTEKLIDELAIWSRALSADEIGQLYNYGFGWAYPY